MYTLADVSVLNVFQTCLPFTRRTTSYLRFARFFSLPSPITRLTIAIFDSLHFLNLEKSERDSAHWTKSVRCSKSCSLRVIVLLVAIWRPSFGRDWLGSPPCASHRGGPFSLSFRFVVPEHKILDRQFRHLRNSDGSRLPAPDRLTFHVQFSRQLDLAEL